MVKDDGVAAKSSKTLEAPNPHRKIWKGYPDGPSLAGAGDTQIGKGVENGSRVSADGQELECVGSDGGKGADDGVVDIGVTLMELAGKRSGKRGSHQLKDGAKGASKLGNGGETDGKIMDMSGGGGSSILRRSKRNRIVVDPRDESKRLKKDEDGEKGKEGEEKQEEEEEDDDEEEEEESEFAVGDFVWGKVKSHPWWPGRVFDPSEASEQALKYKHEGRILVAYFGDATFAWCNSSQLKPFVENFAEMSKQSSSKGFVNAVEEAVSEFSRLVELDMTCYCTPRRNQSADLQSTVNAGIKGGVNVNKGGLGMYSVDRFEPAAFLADLRLVGKHVSVANMLQMTTLKSQVSAIYRSIDGHLHLKINEQQEVADDEGDGAGVEDSFQGPVEDPIDIMPGTLDGLVASKRKERSVAEILYGNEKGKEDGGTVEGKDNVESKSGRKRRKVGDESQKKTGDEEKKTGDEEAPTGEIDHGDELEEEKNMGRRSSRTKIKESPKLIVVENDVAAMEESEMSPRTRERKKSRYLSPPYTDLGYYRQIAVSSPRAPEAKAVESSNVSQKGDTSAKSAAQVTVSPPLVNCSVGTSKKMLPKEDGAEQGKSNGSAPQTPRRRSTRKGVGELTKSIASSDNVLSEIRSAALSGQVSKEDQSVKGFLTSYRSSKYQNGSNYSPCEGSEADDQSGGKGRSTEIKHSIEEDANQESKSMKKSRTKREKARLENKVKDVGLKADGEADDQSGGKGRSTEIKRSKEDDANQESRSVKKSRTKREKAKLENKVKDGSKTDGEVTGSTPPAALHLKFPPDYQLPSKDDLGSLYGKFGGLDTSKTQVSQKSSSARLVFLNGSDAESACKSSKANSPFGAAKVSYRVRHLRANSGDKEVDENGFVKKDSDSQKRTRSSKKQSTTSTSDGGLRLVKQKLEGMATMVAEAGDGKMSKEMKLNLENSLKDLLDNVKALPALPSSSTSGV